VPRLLEASSNYYVNAATYPTEATSPVKQYTLIGAFLGAAIACGFILLVLMFDVAIRTEEDLESLFPEIPILGVIPDFESAGNKSYRQKQEYKL
jgi:capsular polysaccharide biosynthesis protein